MTAAVATCAALVCGLALAGAAQASAPVAGGRYVEHVRISSRTKVSVVLTVANDGKEFVEPSSAEPLRVCPADSGYDRRSRSPRRRRSR